MTINTKAFGEVTIDDDKIIQFPSGIVGYPEFKQFALLHDEEKGPGSIHWLQSVEEPLFALPVMDPLIVKEDYNPEVNDELLKPIGDLQQGEMLVLVTVTVPRDLTKISVNLQGPVIINAAEKKACQVIVGDEYPVKFPIYDILQAKRRVNKC